MELYSKEDVLEIVAYLSAQKPDIELLKACQEVSAKLHWEKKDLAAFVAVSLFGLSLGWQIAEAHKQTEEATKALSLTKALAYDLASFTWRGWDESGIHIGPTDLSLGLSAAKTNLRLVVELSKGHLPLARAHWMLGAHHLAQAEYAHADTNFVLSATEATAADSKAELLLAQGFQALARLLGNLGEEDMAHERMQQVKEALAPLENGSGFVEQLTTAHRIFAANSTIPNL